MDALQSHNGHYGMLPIYACNLGEDRAARGFRVGILGCLCACHCHPPPQIMAPRPKFKPLGVLERRGCNMSGNKKRRIAGEASGECEA